LLDKMLARIADIQDSSAKRLAARRKGIARHDFAHGFETAMPSDDSGTD
jgi:hypothetical protein